MSEFPKELKYNKDYSWIKIEGDTATIGVIEYSAKKVKEFVFIKLPEKGKKIKQNETYVSLEAIKWSGHLSNPLSGKIIEVNNELFNEPSRINDNPYKEWIMKIKIENEKEVGSLINSTEAKKFYEEE